MVGTIGVAFITGRAPSGVGVVERIVGAAPDAGLDVTVPAAAAAPVTAADVAAAFAMNVPVLSAAVILDAGLAAP